MSAGSDASNLGYGNVYPNSNVNSNYVNINANNNPSNFGSNEIPQGLPAAKNNIDAANSCVPGACYKGGKKLKRKIKNITKMYKMGKRSLKKRVRTIRRKLVSKYGKSKKHSGKRHSKKRGRTMRRRNINMAMMRGGYGQYMNNVPNTPSYALGDVKLTPSEVGLANPPPYTLNTKGTCIDNYNHYTNTGFPSKNS